MSHVLWVKPVHLAAGKKNVAFKIRETRARDTLGGPG